MRNWRKRDQAVLAGRKGFVRQAIRSGVPIVPVATIGGHDTVFVLSEGRFLARWTGLGKRLRGATMPIIAGFPFPLAVEILPAHLPLPAKIRTEFLDPIEVDARPRARQRQGVRRLDLPRGRGRDPGGHGPPRQAPQLPHLRLGPRRPPCPTSRTTSSARPRPPRDRLALKVDETEVPYAALDAASARVAGLLAERGVEPGDRVGVMLPNVPYFADRLLRRAARRRRRRADERPAQGARDGVLPVRPRGQGGVRLARLRRGRAARRRRGGRRVHPGRSRRVRARCSPACEPGDRRRRPRRRRHRGDPLHLGHDRARRRAPS